MTNEILDDDKVENMLGQLDVVDLSDVRPNYEGRGMYGNTCFGFIVNQPDFSVGVALHYAFEEDAWDIARAARTDNMGYSTIVYFPGYSLAEDSRFRKGEDD